MQGNPQLGAYFEVCWLSCPPRSDLPCALCAIFRWIGGRGISPLRGFGTTGAPNGAWELFHHFHLCIMIHVIRAIWMIIIARIMVLQPFVGADLICNLHMPPTASQACYHCITCLCLILQLRVTTHCDCIRLLHILAPALCLVAAHLRCHIILGVHMVCHS